MKSLPAASSLKIKVIHPDLRKVIEAAYQTSKVDFIVTEGLRSLARQQELLKAGASTTLNSRHITGHAVDVAALVEGKADWHPQLYSQIADAIFEEAAKLNISVKWGGDWKSFKDYCHFELSRAFYP